MVHTVGSNIFWGVIYFGIKTAKGWEHAENNLNLWITTEPLAAGTDPTEYSYCVFGYYLH